MTVYTAPRVSHDAGFALLWALLASVELPKLAHAACNPGGAGGRIFVRDFDVDPKGVMRSTEIQAAFDAVALGCGGELVFAPEVAYVIDAPIRLPERIPSALVIRGAGSTLRLQPALGATGRSFAALQRAVPPRANECDVEMHIQGGSARWRIEDLTFVGEEYPGIIVKGILIDAAQKLSIEGCRFVGLDVGIELRSCLHPLIEDCSFIGSRRHDIFLGTRMKSKGDSDCLGRRADNPADGRPGDEENCWLHCEYTLQEMCADAPGAAVASCSQVDDARCTNDNQRWPCGPGPALHAGTCDCRSTDGFGCNKALVRGTIHEPTAGATCIHVRQGDSMVLENLLFRGSQRPKHAIEFVSWHGATLAIRGVRFDLPASGSDALVLNDARHVLMSGVSVAGAIDPTDVQLLYHQVRFEDDTNPDTLPWSTGTLALYDAPELPSHVRFSRAYPGRVGSIIAVNSAGAMDAGRWLEMAGGEPRDAMVLDGSRVQLPDGRGTAHPAAALQPGALVQDGDMGLNRFFAAAGEDALPVDGIPDLLRLVP